MFHLISNKHNNYQVLIFQQICFRPLTVHVEDKRCHFWSCQQRVLSMTGKIRLQMRPVQIPYSESANIQTSQLNYCFAFLFVSVLFVLFFFSFRSHTQLNAKNRKSWNYKVCENIFIQSHDSDRRKFSTRRKIYNSARILPEGESLHFAARERNSVQQNQRLARRFPLTVNCALCGIICQQNYLYSATLRALFS